MQPKDERTSEILKKKTWSNGLFDTKRIGVILELAWYGNQQNEGKMETDMIRDQGISHQAQFVFVPSKQMTYVGQIIPQSALGQL